MKSGDVASLKVWNLLLGLIFSMVCIFLLYSFNSSPKSQREIRIYRGALPKTTSENICKVDYVQELKDSAYRDPAKIVFIVFALSAAAHIFYSFSKAYEKTLEFGYNFYRGAEYAITAGLIGYAVSILSGEKQENSALLIGLALVGGYLQFPLIQQATQTDITSYKLIEKLQSPAGIALISAFTLIGGAWYAILRSNMYLYMDAANANSTFSRANFIYALLLSQWFTSVLLLCIQARQVLSHHPRSFVSMEKQSLVFGSLTKLAFAGSIYWGLSYRQKGC